MISWLKPVGGFSCRSPISTRPGRCNLKARPISGAGSSPGRQRIRSTTMSAGGSRPGSCRGMEAITAEGHTILYNGGSDFAQWWDFALTEVADKLTSEGGVPAAPCPEFSALARDPDYWTMTIAFTVTTARKPG